MAIKIVIDGSKCTKCMLCVELCPLHVFYTSEKEVVEADEGKCIGCLACLPLCPAGAIRISVDGLVLPRGSRA
ncbi:indolepyruvate ferredoxin oxidoreductase subunit alpha [Thermogladius sp. 4427co]|uniref:indolepyruvate ferredoxin oxidoreductase subunit alpha n=1 Tax=Thermogladius sp. 4427co TaxID=3450718 RepID=UPI003F7B0248